MNGRVMITLVEVADTQVLGVHIFDSMMELKKVMKEILAENGVKLSAKRIDDCVANAGYANDDASFELCIIVPDVHFEEI